MNFFIGPDGKEYDLRALPSYIVLRGGELLFKTDDVALFTYSIRRKKLPRRISDWDVPKIASSLQG